MCGCEPALAGVARVTTGEHWRFTGGHRGTTGGGWLALALHGGTPTGVAAAWRIRYMGSEISVKNSRFRTVIPVIASMNQFNTDEHR